MCTPRAPWCLSISCDFFDTNILMMRCGMGPGLSSCCWRLQKTPPRPDEGRALSVLLTPPCPGSQSSEVLQHLQQVPARCCVRCLCRRSPREVSAAPRGEPTARCILPGAPVFHSPGFRCCHLPKQVEATLPVGTTLRLAASHPGT